MPVGTAPVVAVEPVDGLIDLPRRITVEGLSPDSLVTLSARTVRAGGVTWEARAVFLADVGGRVDLARDAPVGGDYAEVAAMGLIWGQRPADGPGQGLCADDVMAPMATRIVATASDGGQGEAVLVQRFAGAGVTRCDVRERGLVGTVFTPAGTGPHAVVMVLNGSGGGINEPRAALLASYGYRAFALGYFNAPGLPRHITATPLEYFETALTWVREVLAPADGIVAVSGQSRGGELALLLGATFPELVSAVIAFVPGAVVHGAQGAGDPTRGGWHGPAWTQGGQALPHIWQEPERIGWHPWAGDALPDRYHSVFFEGLKNTALVEQARIPVERIGGPVLLLSGRDDRAWPSSLYARMVAQTLQRKGHTVRHHDFDDAGHSISFPFLPATQISTFHPVSKVPFSSGGTVSGNAKADLGAWSAVLAFLDENRSAGTRGGPG